VPIDRVRLDPTRASSVLLLITPVLAVLATGSVWSLDRPWPDQPDDQHQDSATHAAGSDLTDNRADIESACSSRLSPCSAAQQRPYYLRPYPAADHTERLPRARREDPDRVR